MSPGDKKRAPEIQGRVLVTGCAGFIGSHLTEHLLGKGTSVVGVDSMTNYYARETKKENMHSFRDHPGFEFRRVDLSRDPLDGLLNGVESVYHLAAQPGVRGSFGTGFQRYVRQNITATQRLLEAAIQLPLRSFVYASSSSVYGNDPPFPTTEEATKHPVSPYGMTKVATEELAGVYFRTHGIPVVGMRYFTVYGPRQRPDMAFARFIWQGLLGHPVTIFGDGRQERDFTYVDDAVEATIAAAVHGRPGGVYNIGGGHPIVLASVLDLLGGMFGRSLETLSLPAVPGDVRRTGADTSLARDHLGFSPATLLEDGLQSQFDEARRLGRRALRRARRWFTPPASDG
jgi:UDP-glucuronate 4-epimerase